MLLFWKLICYSQKISYLKYKSLKKYFMSLKESKKKLICTIFYILHKTIYCWTALEWKTWEQKSNSYDWDILKLIKVVDKLHFRGHKGDFCQANCDPWKVTELDGVNTPICEQAYIKNHQWPFFDILLFQCHGNCKGPEIDENTTIIWLTFAWTYNLYTTYLHNPWQNDSSIAILPQNLSPANGHFHQIYDL